MNNFILDHEPVIRLSSFLGILVLVVIWEMLGPRRPLTTSKRIRWYSNLSLVFIDTLAVRLLLPVQAVGVALSIGEHGWGILNNVTLPDWVTTTFEGRGHTRLHGSNLSK